MSSEAFGDRYPEECYESEIAEWQLLCEINSLMFAHYSNSKCVDAFHISKGQSMIGSKIQLFQLMSTVPD